MFKLYTWPLFFVSIIIIEASSVNSNKQCVRCNDICAGMYAYILQCSNNWAHCEHEMLDIFLNSGHNVKDAKKECYAFFDHIGCKEGTIICDRLLVLMTEHIEGENKLFLKANHLPHHTIIRQQVEENNDVNFVDRLILWFRIFTTIIILFVAQLIVHIVLAYFILQVNIIAIIFSPKENNEKSDQFDDLSKKNVDVINGENKVETS